MNKLNKGGIKFITIRRRGKNMVEKLNALSAKDWKSKHVAMAGTKYRTLKVYEDKTQLKDYDGDVRHISITGNGKIKPAIILRHIVPFIVAYASINILKYKLLRF